MITSKLCQCESLCKQKKHLRSRTLLLINQTEVGKHSTNTHLLLST